jgi:outer membrane immunogenic protein
MLRTSVVVAAALILGPLSARAADLATKSAPLPAPQFSWTGAYVGAGFGFMSGEVIGPGTAGNNVGGTTSYFEVNGGYRYEIPYGLVLGFDLSAPVWISSSTFNAPPGAGFSTSKPQFILIPQAQLGYALGRFLPYLGVGVGVADLKGGFTTAAGTSFSNTQLSPVVDLSFGLDYALTDNWIIGVRYDHLDFEQHNYTFSTPGLPTVVQVGAVSDGLTGIVRYKF